MAFRNPIVPHAAVSGFIFPNRDEGAKVVDIDLIGYRAVLVFDRRPRSFMEIDKFDWEQPISNRIERLETDQEPDFDEQ